MLEPPDSSSSQSLAEVERAIAALEAQREVLGDAIVDTALSPLRERLGVLRSAVTHEQRKLVTVLFADLEGFTVLSRRLDAEDTRDVVNRCFSRWEAVIDAHGGVVEKYIGDAVMAVFGLHVAAEDDAVRAVRAGRAMVAELAQIAGEVEERHGVGLHMRVGIDTGEVVVSTLGERAGHEFVAVGPTVNRASRLQGEAPRDSVLISEETRRLVRGRFGLEPKPGLRLKGIDEPVDAFVALAERPMGFDLEPAAGIGGVETATVGRDIELLALKEHLADVVEESTWRITTVLGDAGVGKSRLLAEFDAWLTERPDSVWWFRGRASPSGQNRPHTLLRDAVGTRFGIGSTDSAEVVLERCRAGFAAAFGDSPTSRHDALVVARWLGFEVTVDADDDVPQDPERLRDRASDLLARYLARLAMVAPVVLLLEDLHWADDASLLWLDTADGLLRDSPVLVVATARPSLLEQRPHWGEGLGHHARVTLPPLSRRQSRQLLGQLLVRVDEVPDELAALVVDGAEGNPFFLEELVTLLVDSGVIAPDPEDERRWRVHTERLGRLRVPSTLRGVLQARLDSLEPTERSTLQRASVVGRVFWDQAVRRLGADDEELPEALDRLRSRELVQQRSASTFEAAREFVFRHALLRDVAYDGMLRSHRRAYHARAAAWLVEMSERHGRADEYAFLVAEHADLSGDPAAAGWYLRAGRRAASVFALDEAERLLSRGLELVARDDAELRFDLLAEREEVRNRKTDRDGQSADLDAQAELLDGVSADRRVRHALARSRYLRDVSRYDESVAWAHRAIEGQGAGPPTQATVEAHLGAGKALTWANDAPRARQALDAALSLARELQLPRLEGESLRYLGMLAGNLDDYPRSLTLLDEARKVFASVRDAEGEGAALVQRAVTHFHLGQLPEARALMEEARPLFAKSGYRYGEAVSLGNMASIAAGQGELGAALGWSTEAVALARQMRDVEATAVQLIVSAEIEIQLGRFASATQHTGEAIEMLRPLNSLDMLANALGTLAWAQAQQGEPAEAVPLAREAVDVADAGGSSHTGAITRMLLGNVLLEGGEPGTAAPLYEEAIRTLRELEVHGVMREAQASLAACLRPLGEETAAVALVEELLPHLADGLDGAQWERVWLHCWEVLRDTGDERAAAVHEDVVGLLLARSELVGEDLQEEYLATPVAAALLAGRGRTVPQDR